MNIDSVTFKIPEILSLVGLIQCVYILVYMAFRSGSLRHAILPSVYFLALGTAFFLDFARRFIGADLPAYDIWLWAAWFAGPLLGAPLIIQIGRVTALPPPRAYGVLVLLPVAYLLARVMAAGDNECHGTLTCPLLHEWLITLGLAAGGLSLLSVWLQRGLFSSLYAEREGQARYWLIIMLILLNGAFLGLMLFSFAPWLEASHTRLVRTIIGLGLVYLAGTSLFRIYPQSVVVSGRAQRSEILGPEEQTLASRIEKLFDLDKVYQEPTYSRSHLARELDTSETVVSRIINVHFKKSFPQLLNERRVADAQRLLRETDAPIKQIAEEVGFNSMATFNRVFRDMTGQTPSAYRAGP